MIFPTMLRISTKVTHDAGIVEITEYASLETGYTSRVGVVEITEYADLETGYTNRVAGTSKREPLDKPDVTVGFALAYARALRKLAAKYEKQAQGIVKNGDHIRMHREAIKDRPPYQPTPKEHESLVKGFADLAAGRVTDFVPRSK